MDEIGEDKSNRFIKLFPCVECDTKSKGLEKHKHHFSAAHGDIEYSLSCLFNTCEYSTNNPKALMKHFGEKHEKSVAKLLKQPKQTRV